MLDLRNPPVMLKSAKIHERRPDQVSTRLREDLYGKKGNLSRERMLEMLKEIICAEHTHCPLTFFGSDILVFIVTVARGKSINFGFSLSLWAQREVTL